MIIASAIRKTIKYTSIELFVGNRHSDIINSHEKGFFKDDNSIQGFLTDEGEFLDREQALKYAFEHNQISSDLYEDRIKGNKELFSEDLW